MYICMNVCEHGFMPLETNTYQCMYFHRYIKILFQLCRSQDALIK